MRKLVVNAFVSLDGVMQAPGGPEEDPTGGFTHGGWSVNYWDDEMTGQIARAAPYELLLGRGTYQIFAAHWPYVTDDDPIADHLNSTRKHVASTTLEQVEWSNSTLISGDVADYVATLKRRDGSEIQVHGSPGLIQTLLEHDLVDEFRIWIFPVVLGTGKRLFGDGTIPAGLKLVDSKASKTGVTINTYERAGEIDSGSFEFDEPTEAEIERRRRLAGGLVEDPVLKQRYRFTREGDALTVEAWVDPGGGVTPHVHPAMEERFTVLDGEIEFLVGRRWETRTEIVVPAGTRHAYRNASSEPAHMVAEAEPAQELEAFLTEIAELAQRRRFTRKGLPTSLRAIPELAAVAHRYRETVELETPLRPLIPLAARFGRSRTTGHSTAIR